MKRICFALVLLSWVIALIPMLTSAQDNNTTVKILIPVREFNEFIHIQFDPVTGNTNYSGFAIDVFTEVMSSPPSTLFKFVKFEKPDGTMNGTFDDMLKAVANKEYDGAVGEISILYHRTKLVDFTMPYIESTITMLVRRKPETTKKIGGFSLKGITYTIVIISFVFGFVTFIVAAIYAAIILRARPVQGNNNKSRCATLGSVIQTRLLAITFFLILLTLIACFVISQTSSSEIQSRSGTVENLTELIRNGANVGYREASFIYDLLVIKGFSKSNLKSLKNEDEMVDMLSKGTSNDGVDAIVASAPHLKLLQAKHCANFTLVPTSLHTTGFGFAFQKNSDLGRDVSDGILKIIDNGKLGKIQERTIGNLEVCQEELNSNVASFLTRDHKWILICGGILVGLLICMSIIFAFLNYSNLELRERR